MEALLDKFPEVGQILEAMGINWTAENRPAVPPVLSTWFLGMSSSVDCPSMQIMGCILFRSLGSWLLWASIGAFSICSEF